MKRYQGRYGVAINNVSKIYFNYFKRLNEYLAGVIHTADHTISLIKHS